jgi:S-adenosylmethionine:tRNA ribosyltransferase-isomerase
MIAVHQYDYSLPESLIAREPAFPRESARLFVYDTGSDTVTFDTFEHIPRFIPKGGAMVFNDTKVLPARLYLKKETGGKIEVLLSINELRPDDTAVKGIVDRHIEPGARLFFQNGEHLLVIQQEGSYFFFEPSVGIDGLIPLLSKEGFTPIPPYIKNSPLGEISLRERYQTVFAREGMSIAAPTASLHFSHKLLDTLRDSGVLRTMVTLHVGAGTFAPLTETNFIENTLFTEYCEVSEETARIINRVREQGGDIIAVGSTALRTLETFAQGHILEYGERGTNIFIHPPYPFNIVTGLVTNFHVPKSSLMLMVDAFLEHKGAKRRILDLYKIAIEEKFRFYSFGDGMLIL